MQSAPASQFRCGPALNFAATSRKLAPDMSEPTSPRISKWAFLAGDALLLGVAALSVWQSARPISLGALALCAAAVAAGALLAVVPFFLEYRAAVQLAETDVLATTIQQLRNLETIASSLNAATAQWHGVQDQAAQTLKATREISERITAEAAEFSEFLKRANDAEKATLRLELEKLRRSEGDWLQVVVRLLDNTFALHQAAGRSQKAQIGRPELVEQLAMFQHASRDIARRVGLISFDAQPGESFDDDRHKSADEQAAPPDDSRVVETLAPGIAFQGRVVRPALVQLEAGAPAAEPPAATETEAPPADPSPEHPPAEPGEPAPAPPGQAPLL